MKVSVFDLIDAAANAVVQATWQASLLSLVVIAILFCVGRHIPASGRFGLWLVVFVRFATPWVPASSWSLYSVLPVSEENAASSESLLPTAGIGPIMFRDGTTTPGTPESDQSNRRNGKSSTIIAEAPPEVARPLSPVVPSIMKSRISATQWLTLIWMLGPVVLLVRLMMMWRLRTRRRLTWTQVTDPQLASVFARCQAEVKIRQPVTVLLADDQTGPATCGILKPMIVLPALMAKTLTHQELRLIFLHELIHLRRFDVASDLFASVVTFMHWFNPLAWMALARLRHERELACDAATLELLGWEARKHYGAVLLRAVESVQLAAAPAGAVAMFERRLFAGSLEDRIRSVMDFRPVTRTKRVAGALLLTLIIGIGLTDAVAKDPAKLAPAQQAAPKTFAISGVCLDEAGKPLPDVLVRLYRTDWVRGGQRVPVQEMLSDDQGRYRFADVAVPSAEEEIQMNYVLIFVAPGRASQPVYIQRVDQDQMQSVRMAPAVAITGRVTDSEGKPIADAWVWTQGGIAGEPFDGVMSAKTDADGRYTIHDLDKFDAENPDDAGFEIESVGNKGTATRFQITAIAIRARHTDHVQIQTTYSRAPGIVDFVLPAGGSIEGQVIDAVTRKPAADVIVKVRPDSPNRRDPYQPSEVNFFQEKTDAQGRYRFNGLGATNYTLSVRAVDRACIAVQSGAVVANEVRHAPDLELISGAVIEGQVIDEDNRPVVPDQKLGYQIMVELQGPSTQTQGESTEFYTVSDDGRFRIRVAPGRNRVTMPPDWSGQPIENPEQEVEISTGETRQVIFRVLKQAPPEKHDIPDDDLPIPVSVEQTAAKAIRDLGGSYELDVEGHVIEVNMVYYVTKKGQRYDNDQLTDKALSFMAQFPRLKSLYLTDSQVTDDGFKFIGHLPQLEDLTIWDAKLITDQGVAQLTTLKTLKSFYLAGSQITDQAIANLAKMPSIETLIVYNGDLTDKAFEYAKRLPRLKWLDMRGKSPLSDEAARQVAQMPMLEELTLVGNITNNGLRELQRLKTLKSLRLDTTKVTEEEVLALQKVVPDVKVSALERKFPAYNALQAAADPQRQQINREEGTRGLQQIKLFLKLMSEDKSDQAATLCRSFSCEDPDPSSPEAALEPDEFSAGPAVVEHLKSQIKSFADCDISMAYGDTELVIAITTAAEPREQFRRGADGRRHKVIKHVVLRAVKSHGKWYVGPDDIAGSDDPQWRINYLLGDHAWAQKLLP